MAKSDLTKKALANSLKTLVSKGNFDRITVSDITQRCGINRQTFYFHFNDKYQLLDWIYTQELFIPLVTDLNFDNWIYRLEELFKYMKGSKQFYINTIKCSNNLFSEYLYRALTEVIDKAILDLEEQGVIQNTAKKQKEVMAKFFAHGLTGVVVDWAVSGMKENDKELSIIIKDILYDRDRIGKELYKYHLD